MAHPPESPERCTMTDSPPPLLVSTLRRAGCVFAEDEARLLVAASGSPAELADLTQRRIAGTPLEYLLGWAEFCGIRVAVAPGVFVPRRRTEFLVRLAADFAAPGAVVVDMCCGSGAVGVALADRCAGIRLHSADIDPVCLVCAHPAVESAGGTTHEGDLFEALPGRLRRHVNVIVANAPYVPTDEIDLMPPEARLHEPHRALDGGLDGIDVQRRVIAEAPRWLAPGGHLLIETSVRQAPITVRTCHEHAMVAESVYSPEFDTTVVIARAGVNCQSRDPHR